MKKKYIILTLVLLIIASVAIIGFTAGSLGDTQKSNLQNNDDLTIMVHDGDNYVKQDTIPVGSDYTFNETKSYCEGGSKLGSYDSTLGTIKHTLIGDDKCVVYFDRQMILSQTVIAKLSDIDYTSSQDGTPYRVANQNGIRYEGADPDNYVTYNDEEWRIIGVFDGADIGLESGKKYTKIIKSTPLDTYMLWDDNENDWKNSTLNTYLNGTYLSGLKTDSQAQIAKYNDKYSTWHLLGPEDIQLYTPPDMYRAERDATIGKRGSRNGVANSADASIEAPIGLMYPSDYGYAAYGANCNNETTNIVNSYYEHCASVDWLLYEKEIDLLISPSGRDMVFVLMGYGDGFMGSGGGNVAVNYLGSQSAVRPVLYLEASVTITGGTGQKGDNAYKLD